MPHKVKESESPRRILLRWTERVLWALGLLCLGTVAYAVIDARWFEFRQGRRLDQALRARAALSRVAAAPAARAVPGAPAASTPSLPSLPASPPGGAGSSAANAGDGQRSSQSDSLDTLDTFRPAAAGGAPAPAEEGSVIGRIEIPRVGISSLVLEGVTGSTLRRGVGHIPETALPRLAGNVGLAGHRDSAFRGLKDIRRDDLITLETLAGTYRYRVDWARVVDPGDVGVLAASARRELTLVTCYPFYYVGSAPERFIVRAHLLDGAGAR